MWSDRLVFCDYGFSVSVLWCPLATPTILLGFILLWTWGISSWLLQQSAAAALYLGWGVSPHGCPSWPWTWSSSSQPSCAHTAAASWTWGCSSRLLLCSYAILDWECILVLSVASPDLGRGVAPLGHTSVQSLTAGSPCYKTTHASSYYGARPGWVVSISGLPLTLPFLLQILHKPLNTLQLTSYP